MGKSEPDAGEAKSEPGAVRGASGLPWAVGSLESAMWVFRRWCLARFSARGFTRFLPTCIGRVEGVRWLGGTHSPSSGDGIAKLAWASVGAGVAAIQIGASESAATRSIRVFKQASGALAQRSQL